MPENPTKTITYTYNDSNWKDKLTSFDGKTITYDAIGNPLTYDGYTFTWEEGRQLARIQGNGLDISFKYNDSGIRTEKTVNGVTTKYYLLGDKVILETNGTDKIHYSYDTHDNLVSMNLNGVEYYYVRNGQGDIIALIDANGNEVVTYTYDSWGNIISIDGSLKDTVGVKNPYRYRGYRYDEETKLYYLQSRYYNPEWGRFINADAIAGEKGELLGHNIFAYCINNPIMHTDPSGYSIDWVKKGVEFMKEIYEKFPGFIKNTKSFPTSYGNRIPDFMNKIVIGEIKNVKYQYLSSQIRGFIELTSKQGKIFS